MLSLSWQLALAAAALSSSMAIALLSILWRPLLRARLPLPPNIADAPMALLFENGRLVDATIPARRLLATGPRRLRSAERMAEVLRPLFPEYSGRLEDIADGGQEVMRDSASGAGLTATRSGRSLRLEIRNLPAAHLPQEIEPASFDSLDRELDLLQCTVDQAPILIWQEDAAGAVRWANRAYLELAAERAGSDEVPGWPLPALFPTDADGRAAGSDSEQRLFLAPTDHAPTRCFDTWRHRQGDRTLIFALPADRLEKAERNLHEFVQTLSRTFADLPTGLAIFDRERRLALFNPALTDLTALEPIYLATRPALSDFLDALRNRQRMPEPKNYRSWRDRIASLERAAEDGTYLEDWSLPTGQTYRVTGQPHPNGGIAFLFEDISAEISLTRSFREEVELGQSVIDAMPEAVAVFSANRSLIMANRAYRRLWGDDPSGSIADISAEDVVPQWQAQCRDGAIWARLRAALAPHGGAQAHRFDLCLTSGRPMSCRLEPLPGNALLVGFSLGHQGGARHRGDAAPDDQPRSLSA